MAFEIGKRLGLSQAQLRDVVLAAQMHDVGKIWTPDGILQKPGTLTDETETRIMREHTIRGGEMRRESRHCGRPRSPYVRTTSDGTARAIRTGSPARRSRWRRASCRSRTRTTR